MSKLEKLIEELCPDGIEYKKIKDVYKRIKGTPITAGKMKEIDKWLQPFRALWDDRFSKLDNVLNNLKTK